MTEVTVSYDLAPARVEEKIRQKLIETGWTPPGEESVQNQLCSRIDELERDKEVLAAQLDQAEEALAEAKRAKAVMRDAFATQVQQAVSRARRDWAAQGSPWVKAQWQAEALAEEARGFDQDARDSDNFKEKCAYRRVSRRLLEMADKLRRQAEEGE